MNIEIKDGMTVEDIIKLLEKLDKDRKFKHKEIIDFLIKNPQIKSVKGNHEDMIISVLSNERYSMQDWVNNGGEKALESYNIYHWTEINNIPKEHIEFIKNLPDYIETDKVIISHTADIRDRWTRSFSVYPLNDKFHHLRTDIYPDNILDLLDLLRYRKIVGHEAIAVCNTYIDNYQEYQNLIYNIIDKNLKTRTEAKLINKAFPKLIPQFNVQLCNKYEDYENNVDFENGKWLGARKLDGVRLIVRKETSDEGETSITFWSRSGKPFNTLDVLKKELEEFPYTNIVLDGELCIVDKNGKEDFQSVMKEIRRKNHQIKNPRFYIFDYIHPTDFDKGSSIETFGERLTTLKAAFNKENYKHLTLLHQFHIESKEQLMEDMRSAEMQGWEGLVIRKVTAPYEGKRSKNLLKVKKFQDAEYRVVGIETGPFRVINQTTGLEEEIITMTRINIIHKGTKVGVGSGFKLHERDEYFKNPEKIIGKVVRIQYFEETTNKDESKSLRFPTFCYCYGDKREV